MAELEESERDTQHSSRAHTVDRGGVTGDWADRHDTVW